MLLNPHRHALSHGPESCRLTRASAHARRARTVAVPSHLARTNVTGASDIEVDVAIIGAGIIGLSVAAELVKGSSTTVAVVDRAEPCTQPCATGAGKLQSFSCRNNYRDGPSIQLKGSNRGCVVVVLARFECDAPACNVTAFPQQQQ